jgi:DNA polymerase elongation subunit (family B)
MTDLHSLVAKLKALANETGRTPTLRDFVASGVSKRQIQKHKYSNLCNMAGLEINKHATVTTPVEVVIRPPKILIFDCEISHMIVKVYQLKGNDYISPKNIVKPWHFYSYAGFFKGEREKVYYLDQRFAQDIKDDRQLIEGAHDLISRADVLTGHNVKKFDFRKFNARAALYNLPPIRPPLIIDTLPLFRKHFDLPSYSLGYIAKYFNFKNQKVEHSGDMWDRCEAGDMTAWEENQTYNTGDCLVSEEAFDFIAKFEPSINFNAFYQKQKCICGNEHFYKDGLRYKKNAINQLYRCSDKSCAKTFLGKENLIDKVIRKDFLQ